MNTEYQVKDKSGKVVSNILRQWTNDANYLRENFRQNGNTLWRRQTETTEEAAVRRMAALDKWHCDRNSNTREFIREVETMSEFADRLSPPPAATETQVDWDTLEPVKEVPAWQKYPEGIWIAGQSKESWEDESMTQAYMRITTRLVAIGHTRESALRNLAELQSVRK